MNFSEALKLIDPMVSIIPPIERGNKGKYVWLNGVKDNVFARNPISQIATRIATYNDSVGKIRLCKIDGWPLVFPLWLTVNFINTEVDKEHVTGKDGHRYIIYTYKEQNNE